METIIGSPYRIPLEEMQAKRRNNLGNNLLRLDLTEENRRELATAGIAGCIDALVRQDTETAFVFARLWTHYDPDWSAAMKEPASFLTAEQPSAVQE